jgi:hypothetical protein
MSLSVGRIRKRNNVTEQDGLSPTKVGMTHEAERDILMSALLVDSILEGLTESERNPEFNFSHLEQTSDVPQQRNA